MACGNNKNPLKRGGTSQEQRMLKGMTAGYVSVDERDYADWMVFASEFSTYLNYYDATNKAVGNWKPFFESDVSAVLGSIAIQNVDAYKLEIKSKFDVLKSDEGQLSEKKENLGALFSGILTLCKALDAFLLKLVNDNQFKFTILNLIRLKLQPALKRLLAYYKGGKKLGLTKELDHADWRILGFSVVKAQTRIAEGLSSVWFKDSTTWADFYSGITEDKSIYGDPASEAIRKINHAANHNLFKGLFDQFLMAYAKIIKDAEASLVQTLSLNTHTPHYALFLAFLQLFRFSKEHINTLTQSHLDFYYKEVLRLSPRGSTPNKAHILVELAKQADTYLLKQGSLLKAGKDSLGKEVFYALDKDVVFNKARVAKLMSVYKGASSDNHTSVINDGRLFASSVSNSADGVGTEIETEYKEWHPYINKTVVDGTLTSLNMPLAQIGFAIASSNLFLAEGERLVKVKLAPAFTTQQLTALNSVDCYLTTEEGWYKTATPTWTTSSDGTSSVLSFTIPGDVPAIINYDAVIHGGLFNSNVPLLKVYLTNSNAAAYQYEQLKDIIIDNVELEVKVGLDADDNIITGGLKNLFLSNDFGVLDPAKPFLPFGPAPKKGASLVVGSQELFTKKNARLYFNVNWKDLPASSRDVDYEVTDTDPDANPQAKVLFLEKGAWTDLDTHVSILSDYSSSNSSPNANINFPSTLLALSEDVTAGYVESYNAYLITSINGFVKLSLNEGFGHDEYQKQLTKYLIDLAKTAPGGTPTVTEPDAPYIPTIEKISLHYKASVSSDVTDAAEFETRDIQFFHVYPFGEAEQHTGLNGAANISLLPQFEDSVSSVGNTGELYIGLENLQAGQSVSVLFQLLEGTSNPLQDKPDEHLSWSYLSDNEWKAFDGQSVSDATGQLVQSGIIYFVIPGDASIDNTLLPPGYIWLRASVTENAEAVCKALSVDAQAALVTFQPNNNAPDFQDSALPAGSIAKLKEPSSSIKKITQPYPSFGGRSVESTAKYYPRVSERLRHKSRAITIWDYEHLILEAFPAIHKVKCLNHTRFSGTEYNEIAPGHVTIITIPDLVNRNDANPLRPYTNQNVLEKIEAFLKKKISCHVQLYVRHPQFEEVRLEFKLKLLSGLEFNYYREMLQQEITEFLTPWAYGNASEIDFGGKIHKSTLINFIEERSYVDFITDVKMYHRTDETSATESSDTDTIEASTAKSILVSAPGSKHTIHQLAEATVGAEEEDCVDEYNEIKE